MNKKLPPESGEPSYKYQCLKVKISSILRKYDDDNDDDDDDDDDDDKNLEIINILEDAVYRTNNIITKSYMLLRLWILQKYHANNNVMPIITEETIKMAIKAILIPSSGPKPKNHNALLFEDFSTLRISINIIMEDGSNLSSILNYYATTMFTMIENNIKMHFMDYIKRFINSYFKHLYAVEIENKEFKKQLQKDLKVLKDDIINNTQNCHPKFHQWLLENRYKIVPEDREVNYYYDLKVNTQKYLKYMITMNIELEKIEGKMFQFFPLRTQIIPGSIKLDT